MKNRTLTSRNVLGGFLGGFLGFVAFSLFNLLLPVGCLLGVCIGFWYQEIWHHTMEGYRKSRDNVKAFYRNAIVAPKNEFKQWLKSLHSKLFPDLHDPSASASEVYASIAYWGVRFLIGTLRMVSSVARGILAIVMWPMRRDLNGIRLVTATAVLIFFTIVFWVAWFKIHIWHYEIANPKDDPTALLVMGLVILLAFPSAYATMVAFFAHQDTVQDSLYDDLVQYHRHGFLYLLGYKLVLTAKHFCLSLVFVCAVITYVLLGIVSVLGFMILPMIFAMWVLRALWYFTSMKNHWLCFGVTLTVTVTSALLMGQYTDGAGLWPVAIMTGSVSGLLSELARRVLAGLLNARPAVMQFANRQFGDDPIDSLLVPMWKNRYSWVHRYMVAWIPVKL